MNSSHRTVSPPLAPHSSRAMRDRPLSTVSRRARTTGAILVILAISLLGLPVTYADSPALLDLHTWEQRGPSGNGTWNIASDGRTLLQTVNGNPTFYVSETEVFDCTVRGQITVEDTGDDDFVGFVFGLQQPTGTGTNFDFLLFDWKKGDQSGAYEGYSLCDVHGSFSSSDYNTYSWDHSTTNPAKFEVLDTLYATDKGWVPNQTYEFALLYTDSRIKITIDDTGIFDYSAAPDTFESGLFGFYNYSQANVRYGFFSQAAVTGSDPVAGDDTYYGASAGIAYSVPALQGVLINDHDPELRSLVVDAYTLPQHGTLDLLSLDGAFQYTPAAGWEGADSFTYRARTADSAAYSEWTTVTIWTGNAPPSPGGNTLVDDPSGGAISVSEDSPATTVRLNVPTLHNPDGADPTSIRVISVTGGSLTQGDGSGITLGTDGTLLSLTSGYSDFRFTPTANRNTDASFVYVVVDPEDTALNSTESTATIPVTPINDAPVLDTSTPSVLAPIDEDPVINLGTLVSDMIGDSITDVDTSPVEGIGLTAADEENGTWEYSLDGGATWAAVGAVAPLHVRALPSDTQTRVRFVPDTNWNGTAAIYYRAWDQTSGSGGTLCDTGPLVNTSAYGDDVNHALLTVNPVDDPPVLGVSGSTVFAEDTAPAIIDPDLTLTDPEDDDVSGAQVAISSGFVTGQDVLGWDDTLATSHSVTGTWDSGTGILSFTGVASPAAYQAVLRTVTYANASSAPDTNARTITFSLGDDTLYCTGTGHYYEFVPYAPVDDKSWTTARGLAESRSLYGLQGYLTTVTSAAENDFISGKLQGQGWMGASDAELDKMWYWVTGPEAGTYFFQQHIGFPGGNAVGGAYVNWNIGEPNDYPGGMPGSEDYGHFLEDGHWNDYPVTNDAIQGYVVEYGGLPGDPSLQLTGSLTVTVQAVNDAPVLDGAASPTLTTIAEDTADPAGDTVAQVVVDGSITDLDGEAVEAVAVTAIDSAHGTWQYSLDGGTTWLALGPVSETQARLLGPTARVRFVPAADWFGTTTCTFRAWDQTAGSEGDVVDASVNGGTTPYSAAADQATITVTNVNDAPVTVNDDFTVDEDSVDNPIDVLANDTDADGDPLSVRLAGDPCDGTVTTDGTLFYYTPNPDFPNPQDTAHDVFVYKAVDIWGEEGLLGWVSIKVNNVNDAPVAVDDSATVDEDSTGNALNVLVNDTDADGDDLTISAVADPAHGTATTDGALVYYTPDPDYPNPEDAGTDSLTYTISDGEGGSGTGTLNVTVTNVNDTVVVRDDTATVTEDSTGNAIDVLANDTDADGDPLGILSAGGSPAEHLAYSIVTLSEPTHGSVTTDGTLIYYTPAPNFPNPQDTGTDTFTYEVSDGIQAVCGSGTVTVTVTNVNDAPVPADDVASTPEDTACEIHVLANDSDPDGDALTITIAQPPAHGTASVTAGQGIHYVPAQDYFGPDDLVYSVSDGTASVEAGVSLQIAPVNDPPVIGDIDGLRLEAGTVAGPLGIFVTDVDTDLDDLSISVSSSNQDLIPDANLAVQDTGDQWTLTLTPILRRTGCATITVTICDAEDCATKTFDLVYTNPPVSVLGIALISQTYPIMPDLVVDEINVADGDIAITVRNTGRYAVTDEFWVDLYINPRSVPVYGQNWDQIAPWGAVWGVTEDLLPLAPGEAFTLHTGDAHYWADWSFLPDTLPENAAIYAQVDAVSTGSLYGSVLEIHEILGTNSNNVTMLHIDASQPLWFEGEDRPTPFNQQPAR